MSNLFPPSLRSSLFGTPFGEVFPPKGNPSALSVDGRTVALRILQQYICNLTFFLPGIKGGPPKPFQILLENFHIEWPDQEEDLRFPGAVVMPSRGDYDVIGLVAYVEESTRDLYAPGTVLQWQGEYVETIQLDLQASSRPERRSMIAGIETALTPTEQMSGLRFRMKDYFNELVCFTLNDRENMDDRFSANNRRRTQLGIEMRFNIVALVNYNQLTPIIQPSVDVTEPNNTPIIITADQSPYLNTNSPAINLLADPNARVAPTTPIQRSMTSAPIKLTPTTKAKPA